MVLRTSLANFFTAAGLMLDNARDNPEIAAALDAFGYDADKIGEGQALLEAAQALYDAQIQEYGEQYAATEAFREAFKQADKQYGAHRRLAKLAFKNDIERQANLRLNQRKPQVFSVWYEQARHFYQVILEDTEGQAELARYKVTLEELQGAQEKVEQAFAQNDAQEQEKGEAQQATKDRDEAIDALDEWLADFKEIARLALEDNPQLLEALGLGAIP